LTSGSAAASAFLGALGTAALKRKKRMLEKLKDALGKLKMIPDSLKIKAFDWSFKYAAKKAAKQAAALIAGWFAAQKLQEYGLQLEVKDQAALSAGLFMLFDQARKYLKHRFGLDWM